MAAKSVGDRVSVGTKCLRRQPVSTPCVQSKTKITCSVGSNSPQQSLSSLFIQESRSQESLFESILRTIAVLSSGSRNNMHLNDLEIVSICEGVIERDEKSFLMRDVKSIGMKSSRLFERTCLTV